MLNNWDDPFAQFTSKTNNVAKATVDTNNAIEQAAINRRLNDDAGICYSVR